MKTLARTGFNYFSSRKEFSNIKEIPNFKPFFMNIFSKTMLFFIKLMTVKIKRALILI